MKQKWVIITLSSLMYDSRLQRQIELFKSLDLDFTVISVEQNREMTDQFYALKAANFSWKSKVKIAIRGVITFFSPSIAEKIECLFSPYYAEIMESLKTLHPTHLYLNDWHTLIYAGHYQRQHHKKLTIIYDSHEWARGELLHNRLWRWLVMPYVVHIENKYTLLCHKILTVSDGLAKLYHQALPHHPRIHVIRNLPKAIKFRPSSDINSPIKLLYHGILHHGRGIELLIDCLARVKLEYHLTLKGYGSLSYIEGLNDLIASKALQQRVKVLPASNPENIVESASHYDIGLFTPSLSSDQINFALPNKLFEYIAAGLMVISRYGSDISAIIDKHKVGITLDMMTPETLSAVLNTLDITKIAEFKHNSQLASLELNWEKEQNKLKALLKNEA